MCQLLSYAGGKTLHYGDASLSARLGFVSDPTKGDASVSIGSLLVSDTATYQCKVKKAPGVDMRKVTVVVMGETFLHLSVVPLDWFLFGQFHPLKAASYDERRHRHGDGIRTPWFSHPATHGCIIFSHGLLRMP